MSMNTYSVNVQDQVKWQLVARDQGHAEQCAFNRYSQLDSAMDFDSFKQISTIERSQNK